MIFRLQPIENKEEITDPFYVIKTFQYPQFVLNKDGDIKLFDSYNEALEDLF